MFIKIVLALILSGGLLCGIASAVPTVKLTKLVWDAYTDTTKVGYWLYWAMQSEPTPRVYDNTRRVDAGNPVVESLVVATVLPTAKGSMCFKATARDAAGNESDFSNEACGFFGFTAPGNLKAQ